MPIRILVADDHEIIRRGLRAVLEDHPGWEVVGEAVNGSQAVERVMQLQPDIILLDITMPGTDGLQAARQIRKEAPQTEVLILTQHDSPQMVRQALDAGARGYLLKADMSRDLVRAIDTVRQQKKYLSSTVARYFPQAAC